MFKRNIGTAGRIGRFVMALFFLFLAIGYQSWVALFISLFVFFEVFMGWCVVYQFLGKTQCPLDSNKKDS